MPRDIQKRYATQAAHRERNFQLLMKYLEDNPCVDCGESDVIVLDLDHLPGTQKRFDIARAVSGSTRSWKLIKEEIDKCESVCANCHRKRTAQRGNYKRYNHMPS